LQWLQWLQRIHHHQFRKWFIFWGAMAAVPANMLALAVGGCCEQGFRSIPLAGTKWGKIQPGNHKKNEIPDFIFFYTF
jgi:hypothetical protein